ncbi:MAG: DUF448 domain-containing protein [Candidatus Tyrphobacter sp.]
MSRPRKRRRTSRSRRRTLRRTPSSSVSSRSSVASALETNRHVPLRQCVGCRRRMPQARLVRFVRAERGWLRDALGSRRNPGRGAYLCSSACAQAAAKNRRYPGLASAAAEYGSWNGSKAV